MWIGQLPVGRADVTALAFAPDGRTLYSGDSKGHVRAWDTATHAHRELWKRGYGVHDLWPTPDGARLLVRVENSLLDALHPDAGPLLGPGADGGGDWRYLLPDGERVMSCEHRCAIGLWSLRTGERLTVPGELGRQAMITHHDLLPDGRTLLTYETARHEIVLWDLETGRRVGELAPSGSGINPCARSEDGVTFAVGRGNAIWVYDVPSRALRHKLKFEKEIRFLAFHPNGTLLASASPARDGGVTFWDTVAGQQLKHLNWKIGQVKALAFAPDGLTCAVGGCETFVVFDVEE